MRVPILGRRLYSMLMFALVSVLGGLLLAGLFVPAAGMAAEGGKSVATALNSLPEELKVGPPAEGSKVLMADGRVLTSFYDQYRKNVPLDQIAPSMRMAQVGIEDQRFYEHGALDLKGTLRALVRSSSGQAQGGSTLTQQYVKLALLYDAAARNDAEAVEQANSRTVNRKILELRYAIALEKQLTKDQILERYLNIAFYGDKAYGIEAAAQHYFGVPAKDLSLSQSAMLAGIVRNPVTTNPIANEAAATERMRNVLDRISSPDVGLITPAEAEQAKQYKFDKTKVKPIEPRGCSVSPYPHLCDYVEQVLLEQTTSLGADQKARRNTLNQAGLTIRTNIDPRFQDAAQEAVSNFIAPTDPVIGSMTLVQPGTGRIMAMAQSRDKLGDQPGQTFWNYSAANNMNGFGTEGGSTFKAFTATAALMAGKDALKDYIQSPAKYTFKRGTNFGGCGGPQSAVLGVDWPISTGADGNFNMYMGATYSSNTFFAQLEQQVGVCNVVKAAELLGLQRADGANLQTGILPSGKRVAEVDGNKPTFTLGNSTVSALSITNAYATLAARGKRCDPVILDKITDGQNREYAVPAANCQQVIKPEIADRVNDILHGPYSYEGTAEKAMIPGYLVSGKTGTQSKAPRILTAGYTPDIAGLAYIVSDPKHPEAMANKAKEGIEVGLPPIKNLVVHGKAIKVAISDQHTLDYTSFDSKTGFPLLEASGTMAGASIWKPTMLKVLPLLPKTQFVRPADSPYAAAQTNTDISDLQTSGQIPTEQNPEGIPVTPTPSPTPTDANAESSAPATPTQPAETQDAPAPTTAAPQETTPAPTRTRTARPSPTPTRTP